MNHKVLCKLACIKRCECTLVAFMRYHSRFWPCHVLLGQSTIFYVMLFVSILWDWTEITWKELTMHSNDIWHSLVLSHDISLKVGWKWKWPNGVGKGQMDLLWCKSMTNNEVSYQKSTKRLKQPSSVILKCDKIHRQEKYLNTLQTYFNYIWPIWYGSNFSGRAELEFGVIFFVFLSTFFGNL